jgi:hypothetical protein
MLNLCWVDVLRRDKAKEQPRLTKHTTWRAFCSGRRKIGIARKPQSPATLAANLITGTLDCLDYVFRRQRRIHRHVKILLATEWLYCYPQYLFERYRSGYFWAHRPSHTGSARGIQALWSIGPLGMPTSSSSAVDWSRESEQSPLLSPQNAPDKRISTSCWIVNGSAAAASCMFWILTVTCGTVFTRWICWTFPDQTLRFNLVDLASIITRPSHYPTIHRVNHAERIERRNSAKYSYQRAKVRVAEDKEGFPSFWNLMDNPFTSRTMPDPLGSMKSGYSFWVEACILPAPRHRPGRQLSTKRSIRVSI